MLLVFAACFIFSSVALKELVFNYVEMSFCSLVEDRCFYVSSYICTVAQNKKNEVFYSLYFSWRSGASVLAGSCQGHVFFYIAKVSLYQIKGGFKIYFMAVYKGQREKFLFIKVV